MQIADIFRLACCYESGLSGEEVAEPEDGILAVSAECYQSPLPSGIVKAAAVGLDILFWSGMCKGRVSGSFNHLDYSHIESMVEQGRRLIDDVTTEKPLPPPVRYSSEITLIVT